MIDAIDIFGIGGYIDLQTMEYIHPKWYADEFEPEKGLTEEDYRRFDSFPTRYLTTPRIRSSAVDCMVALRMGVDREQLIQMGFNKEEYWDVFCPQGYESSDDEWDAMKKLANYMRSIGKYYDFCCKGSEVLMEPIKEWLLKKGIEVCE